MKAEINRIYNIFQSIVGSKGSRISDKDFVDLIKKNKLHAECTENQELLKLSVLSSHREWEVLFRAEHIYLNECIGAECGLLTEKGLEYFNISPYELELLREEVVYGNTKYSVLINDIKELIELNKKKPNDSYCRYLIFDYLQLHNVEKVRCYIEELKSYKDNVLCDFEVPIYIARLYDEIIYYKDEDLYDEQELQYALDLFEQTYLMNKRLNIFDPVIYAIYYIKTIKHYLSYMDKYEHNFSNKYTKFYDQPKNVALQNEFFKPRYSYLNSLDEDFVFKVDAKTIALIEKHDDLILSILPYYDYTLNYDVSPIFKGTNTLIWKYYLNNSLPGKLDYFLNDLPSPIIRTPLDLKQEQLKEMLLKEFKTEQEIESINERYMDIDGSDEDEGNDYDELEEDDINIPEFYDDDYSLKTDDLITSMSNPDWKNVLFDSFILSDLIDIIKDINQSIELKIASCKAISLIDYEDADVLLVKALRDQEDAVKQAALEGLINLKKPIDEDCFEVLNNFSNKEITNPIILSKIQDAIKSDLIKKSQ